MTEPEFIDPKQIRPGPIRHDSLAPELLESIHVVFEVVGPYLNTTLEQFELNFMRDLHPDREVAVWLGIATVWDAYHKKYLNDQEQSEEVERQILGALIAISSGVEDPEVLGVPADVGKKLLACWEEMERE